MRVPTPPSPTPPSDECRDNPVIDVRIIDVHAHILPEAVPALAQVMDENGLERVVNLGVLEERRIPFDEGMRAFRQGLGDRMAYFAAPDFRDTAAGFGDRIAAELARKVDAGARGLKIFKRLGLEYRDDEGRLIPIDDPRLDPLWARAGELGIPVLIHTADPVAFFQPLDERNERREELLRHPDWHFGVPGLPDHDTLLAQRNCVIERHPGTTFIGAHLGNYPEKLGYVDDCLARYPNFNVDTSARIGEIGRHPAADARAFFVKHQDRILFGTDLLMGFDVSDTVAHQDMGVIRRFYDAYRRFFETGGRQIEYPEYPHQGRWKVDAIGLPGPVIEKLYRFNAQRLIPGL